MGKIIVSVTANTTIDQTLFVPALTLNRTIRASKTVHSMGGKPTDASWILGEMGISSLALGFAAGGLGEKVKMMLHARGVETDFIQVGGETRMNVVLILEDGTGQLTVTTSTLQVSPEHIDQLREKYQTALQNASCVVLGGTLPQAMIPEFYTEFISLARFANVPVIFDADEPNLSAGLKSSPAYIKPNQEELSRLAGREISSLDEAYDAGQEILNQYGTAPIITLGAQGTLAVLPHQTYFIPPLELDVVSTSGAGDGMLAGIAASVHQGLPIEEGLKLGTAAASAVCLLPGTADCRREDVERLLPHVELQEYKLP